MISKNLKFLFGIIFYLQKRSSLLLFFLLTTCFASFNWSLGADKNEAITNYYYYRNQPYYLTLRTDKIFIQTKEQLTSDEFSTLLKKYYRVTSAVKFDKNEKRQFVNLAMQYDESSINGLIEALDRDPGIEFSSPVFSPPDNNKVLQGVLNEILVQFKPSVTVQQINNFLHNNNLSITQIIKLNEGSSYVLRSTLKTRTNTLDLANTVYQSGIVNWCDPNFYFSGLLCYIPNDQYFPMQWSLRNTGTNIPVTGNGIAGCDMRVDSAWIYTLGNTHCIICMVDSGIDTTQEDLTANLIGGYDFINGHAGYYDDFNHGTCTAGIVAAIGNNSIGISGVAPHCKLQGAKIFNSGGSTSSTAITNGLLYSWQQGAWISSNSWGGGSPISAADNAILNGVTSGRNGKGTVFCFASGNNNGALTWPSTNANVIAVGGNSPCNERKSLTSCDLENFWGADYGTGLHVVAPCVKVYSTDRMGTLGYDPTNYFSQFNGTSSATPNCAGTCALLLCADSVLTWDSVRVNLCRYADKVGSYSYTSTGPLGVLGSTWNTEMGYGKVNAYRLLRGVLGPPAPPAGAHIYSKDSVNFGNVIVGLSSDTTVLEVYNYGGDTLRISNITVQNSNFSLAINPSYPIRLRYMDSVSIRLLFRPTSTGVIRDTLKISSNDDTIAVKKVILKGTGYTVNPSIGGTIYGITGTQDNGAFITVSQSTGNGTLVGPTGFSFLSGVSIRPSNRQIYATYSTAANTQLVIINASAGDAYQIATIPLANMRAIAFDLNDDLYGATITGSLYKINISSGSPTMIGNTNIGFMYGMAVNPVNGQLWGVSAMDSLYKINKLNASSTNVGSTNMSSVPSITFDIQGKLFGVSGLGSQISNLIRIDTSSGAGTLIGSTGYHVTGIAISPIPIGIVPVSKEIPSEFKLYQNFPNPFNPATKIKFDIPANVKYTTANMKLVVYDILGKEVVTLFDQKLNPGTYEVEFNAGYYSSGIYFYKITAGNFIDTKKLVLIK